MVLVGRKAGHRLARKRMRCNPAAPEFRNARGTGPNGTQSALNTTMLTSSENATGPQKPRSSFSRV